MRRRRGVVLTTLSEWLTRRRESRTLAQRAIPDALWQRTLARFPFLTWRTVADVVQLRSLTTLFLADKEFAGTRGLAIDDEMAVAIAAQACLPVLKLGLAWYEGVKGIVVHADAVIAHREFVDDAGVVHAYEEELTGEAMQGGPVMLAWRDVDEAGASVDVGYNVVIHEFTHVMDMRNGFANGVPKFSNRNAQQAWVTVFDVEYTAFCERIDTGVSTFLDPYAADAPEEFFAVACEAFFVAPREFRDEQPRMYELLEGFFRQDPATHMPA